MQCRLRALSGSFATTLRLAAITAFFLPATALAQHLEVRIGEDLPVGEQLEGKMLVEPHLAAHPSDAGRLLAVGWATTPDSSEAFCLAFTSSNSGRTWSQQRLEGALCMDPWVTLTGERALLTMLGTHPALPDERTQLLVFFSSDGGASWSATPQSLGRYHDGPRSLAGAEGAAYVTSGASWRDSAGYLRFGVFLGQAARGTDHVTTRSRILPSNLNQVADGAAVLSDGAIVVTYDDFQRPVGGPRRAFRSRAGALETRRVWAMISTDQGQSFSPPNLVTEACYDRPTFLAVDSTTGSHRDRLYHVCPGHDYRTILLASSADRGEEWTDATPVEAAIGEQGSRREPVIAVNRAGVVAVAWMDRRDTPGGNCYAPYFAASADGGVTFSTPVRVASEPSCPDPEKTDRTGGRFPTGGDYFGLAAAADGRFHVLWPDARDGTFQLRTAAVSVDQQAPSEP